MTRTTGTTGPEHAPPGAREDPTPAAAAPTGERPSDAAARETTTADGASREATTDGAAGGGYGVRLRMVTQRFGRTTALDHVDLDVRPGTVTGLLGRNSAGKSTLAALVAGFRRPTVGSVHVDGEDPWENPRVAAGTCLVREAGDVLVDRSLRDNLRYAAGARPTFAPDLALELCDRFGLDLTATPTALSRGRRSAFGIVLGLASRAPLTILDEVTLGLDSAARQVFHDALIADYAAHPRTIVVATHLVAEVEPLLEDVVVLDAGRVLVAGALDDLQDRAVTLTGPAGSVDRVAAGHRVVGRQEAGPTVRVTVLDADDTLRARARELGVHVGRVGLQDLLVDLTAPIPPAAPGTAATPATATARETSGPVSRPTDETEDHR